MKRFRRLRARAVTLLRDDIDTDQIIPARFLKGTGRAGMAEGLFANWRFGPDKSKRADFPLNRPEARGARILITGENFGCGSSREHAAWALADFGFRAIVSPGFADIFRNNALKNGLLPAEPGGEFVSYLADACQRDPSTEIDVDLSAGVISCEEDHARFEIDPFARRCLLDGRDPFDYLLSQADAIDAFAAENRAPIDTLKLSRS